jgi:hypothetical protein
MRAAVASDAMLLRLLNAAQPSKRAMATDISNIFSHMVASPTMHAPYEHTERRAAKIMAGTPDSARVSHQEAAGQEALVSCQELLGAGLSSLRGYRSCACC